MTWILDPDDEKKGLVVYDQPIVQRMPRNDLRLHRHILWMAWLTGILIIAGVFGLLALLIA